MSRNPGGLGCSIFPDSSRWRGYWQLQAGPAGRL
nr:MAG TPA: hypothetical protein [Caudoviricetes sp.]